MTGGDDALIVVAAVVVVVVVKVDDVVDFVVVVVVVSVVIELVWSLTTQQDPNMNPSIHMPRWVPFVFMHSQTNMQ